MTKTYDPQYSTQVAFNRPIMSQMLQKRDITLLQHWFEHGEPNKNLAATALEELLFMGWIEALDLLWDLGWLTKKNIVTKSWTIITAPYGRYYNEPIANTPTEHWLINKTYNEKVLSANELNNLRLTILAQVATSSKYYWDMFFVPELKMKGKLSHSIFSYVSHSAYYDKINTGNKLQKTLDNIGRMKERLAQIITHKNGFECPYYSILNVLITYEDSDMFWLIMKNKFVVTQKELFILATLLSVYMNVVGKKLHKMTDEEVDSNIHELLICLVAAGLKETVTFTSDDFLDTYKKLFESGYMSLRNINMLTNYGFNTSAHHLECVPTYHNHPNLRDITFYVGDAVFSKPRKVKFDEGYHTPTPKESAAFREKMSTYFK
jgi:hypothetical protein